MALPEPPPFAATAFLHKAAPVTKNPMLGKSYAQLGRNLEFEARPSVVHFGGYQLHEIHTQYLRVINISSTSQRLNIINPTTPHFKVRCDKRGIVAPGMEETIAIDFIPHEWKYHYDCIRIFTEGENILVPIHAYPVMNQVEFPKWVDFGQCELSATHRKVFSLECNVPIQFEYELTIEKHHSDFKVFPMRGVVPANDAVKICIEFTPLSFGTCTMELRVNVSQFNFEPFVCKVTGTAVPGLVRSRQLEDSAEMISTRQEHLVAQGAPESLRLTSFAPQGTAVDMIDTRLEDAPPVPHGSGSGAVFDAGTDWAVMKRARNRAMGLTTQPEDFSDHDMPETDVEGLKVPYKLDNPSAVNYVLTQQPGKLKPKALKLAIREQRAIKERQKAEQEALRAQTGALAGGLSAHSIRAEEEAPLVAQMEGEGQSRQLRELAFKQDLQDLERDEKEREFKSSQEFIGVDLLTPEEIEQVTLHADAVKRRMAFNGRERERGMLETVARGPYEVPALYARAQTLAYAPLDHEPKFDPYTNDLWCKRRATLQQFVYYVGKWIVRRRADRRLKAIKARLAGASTREEVRNLVELDNQQAKNPDEVASKEKEKEAAAAAAAASAAATSVVGVDGLGDGVVPPPPPPPPTRRRFEISAELIQPSIFPGFAEDNSSERTEMLADEPEEIGFQDFTFFHMKAAQEAAVVGYKEFEVPAVDSYLPACDRESRTGAVEESGVRAPRDQAPGWVDGYLPKESEAAETPADQHRDPAAILDRLYVQHAADADSLATPMTTLFTRTAPKAKDLDYFRPSRSLKTFTNSAVAQETDVDWQLRPQPIPYELPTTYGARLANSIGSSTLHVYKDMATIATNLRPRRQRRASALLCLQDQHRQVLWKHEGVPKPLAQPDANDVMSDSESDDEGGDDVVIPTADLAMGCFDPDNDHLVSEFIPTGATDPVVTDIARDVKMLELEAKAVVARNDAALELPMRLQAVSAKVSNARNAFLLQRPYHLIQEREAATAQAKD
mmetsp:Transcript_35904/g.83232  ORF Transcript_35904/g.83232 Transcript_35904/m.83232 type:complete len:1012 (+) Transcript_35904:171-3206(+)|eukprot:CAMPEP_0182565722 /NCGR_PEP_ID=MMETSP1324-20130603/7376_1 /TAXON_ID=236786 /ORGANISM="Florenciella sp., Strain RCC1587" /LENGTH=1011 /DNA_ID=CAMNT_0024779425 /DNA_START=95 /DNA_END=3130 /DNA_ORIENTATION=+